MDGTLPEEPGQPALSPRDVEPTSETVRSKDLRRPGFLSSQKRPVRFNRFWDLSTRPNVHASCRWWHLPIKFIPPGFIRAHPRGPSLNGCKECLEQSPTQSPSRSQVSPHDEWERGWSIYSGALWAKDAIRTG